MRNAPFTYDYLEQQRPDAAAVWNDDCSQQFFFDLVTILCFFPEFGATMLMGVSLRPQLTNLYLA